MGYEIIREPFMLLETVEMLYRYVNCIAFQSVLGRIRLPLHGGIDPALQKRLERLQGILEEVCEGLDPDDPLLQRYFARVHTSCAYEVVYLARAMTYSFCTLKQPELHANAREICEIWKRLQQNGVWIHQYGVGSLEFSDRPSSPGDLFKQICALDLPPAFQLRLYDALRNFEESMAELVSLLEPLAQKLEACYQRERWLLEDTEANWRVTLTETSPLEYLAKAVGDDVVHGAGEDTLVGISLMSCDTITYDMVGMSSVCEDCNILYIGCAVTPSSTVRNRGTDLERIGTTMKSLSDKRRLEILQRLSKERSYCQELAESMGVDPGNMSRNLAILYNCGFLRLDREALRNYYRTDPEAIRNFLKLLETTILNE